MHTTSLFHHFMITVGISVAVYLFMTFLLPYLFPFLLAYILMRMLWPVMEYLHNVCKFPRFFSHYGTLILFFWWNQYFLWRGYLQVIYTDPVVVHQYTCLSTDCSFLFRNTLCFFWPLHWSSFQLTFWHGKDFFIRANGFNRKKHNKIYE